VRALVYRGKDSVGVEDRPTPELGAEEALIRVHYAGICGSDLSIVAGKHPRAQPGLIMGHEFSGEIVEVRSEARPDLKAGDRVVVEPLISCGVCHACRSGFGYVCQNLGLYGIDAPGAFAEYVTVAADKVYAAPDAISLQAAAMVEPVAVAVHAVRLSSLRVGDSACVLGGGPIGLLTALVVRAAGARRVLLCEKQTARLELARDFGLDTVDASCADPAAEVDRATNGVGADVVFEAAGAPETFMAAPRLCRVRGEVVIIAMPKDPREMDIVGITFRELRLTGVRVYAPFDFERAIRFMADSGYDFTRLQSAPFALDRAEEALRTAREAREVMRVVFGMR